MGVACSNGFAFLVEGWRLHRWKPVLTSALCCVSHTPHFYLMSVCIRVVHVCLSLCISVKKERDPTVLMPAYPCLCLPIHLFVCLCSSLHFHLCLSVCVHLCLSTWSVSRLSALLFPSSIYICLPITFTCGCHAYVI